MRNNIKLFGALVFTALLFSACETKVKEEVKEVKEVKAVIDMDKLRVEIQAMEDAFAAGQQAKDADAVAAYYHTNAVSYGQNEKPIVGKKAIRDNMAKELASDTTSNYNVYKIVDLFADGNIVVEIGSWTEFDADGNQKDNGNYMSYFEKHDGKYVCVRDMSTTATPRKKTME